MCLCEHDIVFDNVGIRCICVYVCSLCLKAHTYVGEVAAEMGVDYPFRLQQCESAVYVHREPDSEDNDIARADAAS